jgi:hypothetical protein
MYSLNILSFVVLRGPASCRLSMVKRGQVKGSL